MYLSRAPWQPDEERVQGNGPIPASAGLSGSAAGPGIASAGAPVSDVGAGAPGALRAFFEANRDQGSRVLGGLADSLNQRISDVGTRFADNPPSVGAPYQVDYSQAHMAPEVRANLEAGAANYNKAQADAAAAYIARNKAAAEGLTPDVNRLGTQEGQQSLLEQQYGSGNYTPGQARLDAWLAGAAANREPAIPGGVQSNYAALQSRAGQGPAYDPLATPFTPPADPNLWSQWLAKYYPNGPRKI